MGRGGWAGGRWVEEEEGPPGWNFSKITTFGLGEGEEGGGVRERGGRVVGGISLLEVQVLIGETGSGLSWMMMTQGREGSR